MASFKPTADTVADSEVGWPIVTTLPVVDVVTGVPLVVTVELSLYVVTVDGVVITVLVNGVVVTGVFVLHLYGCLQPE